MLLLSFIRWLFILIVISAAGIILNSCVETFIPELQSSDLESQLVVEGMVTDETGPFKVRLTRSTSVYDTQNAGIFEPVIGADVHITDDKGNDFHLLQSVDGWYRTIDTCLQGNPGSTYTLHITDRDGNLYESTPEKMQKVPDIDSVYFEEVKKNRFENGLIYEDSWLNILLDTHDPEGKTKYWLWNFEETWEIRMLTTVLVKHGSTGTGIYYSYENVSIDPEKEVCWVRRQNSSVNIYSTLSSESDVIKKFIVQSLGPGEDKLNIRYSILVKQYSLNRELFNYWKQLEKTNEETSGIYSTVHGPIYGNIQCVSGSGKALGYFMASCVVSSRIFIESSDHHITTVNPYKKCTYLTDPDSHLSPYWIYFSTILNTDIKLWVIFNNYCVDCTAYGTNVKPDYW